MDAAPLTRPTARTSEPDARFAPVFTARAAGGGVVRRSIDWVDGEIGRDRFIDEVRRRGFHLLETRNQVITVCNRDAVYMLF